jgi:2-polyprenyl-3-methyl-5-hydroxy-6-metoxy-1,4-benzoquinol methylase
MAIDPSLIETVACPLCAETRYEVIRPARYPEGVTREELLKIYSSSSDQELMDPLVRCFSCSLVYLNPRVKTSIILNSYAAAVDPVFFEQNPMRIKTFARVLRRVLKKESIVPAASKKVLDIGCAGGAFPKAAADLGFSAVGVEPSAWLCEQGKMRYGLDLRPGVLSEQAFAPLSFFMVTLWDVLEHLTQPGESLDEARRILTDDGLLIINVPNLDSWVSRILGNHWPFLLNVHLTYFTPKTLTHMLKRHGFRVMSVTPYFQTLELGYVMTRAAQIARPFSLMKKLVEILRMSHWPFFYNMGQMTVVARKA